MKLALFFLPAVLLAQEPDVIGLVYNVGDGGKLIRLEKQTAFLKKVRGGPLGNNVASIAQIPGDASPVHLEGSEFIVRLAPGGDPTKFHLYGFDVEKGNRVVTLMLKKDETIRKKIENKQRIFDIDVKPVSDTVYKLVPTEKLTAGEYGFALPGVSNDVFCFSVQ